ncbi:MAG: efflux RND transporter periplasmic adaptor subunit [Desulfomonilaceae bacterium]|nr:efflux RND transporter periplasmic adaptor subunit [Desulfomonilaceae bacterium]
MMTARQLRKKLPIVAIALVLVAAVAYRFVFMAVPVSAVPVVKGTVVREAMGTGTLQARVRATISAKIQGRLVETPVDQNDRVAKGRLMARLDDAELRQSVQIADAGLSAAKATAERVQADLARAKAVFDQAQKDHDRYLSLRATQSVSESDVDKSRERLEVAEADLARSQAAITEAERQVITAEERLQYEQARLADTRILAPFDGLVVKRDREPGDIIVPGASIFQVISTDEMWVSAWVDESAMAQIQPGQPARVVFRSEPDKEHRGIVVRMSREVDTETREFLVDVRVDDLPANWAVGQRAEAYIETSRKSGVLVVPATSIVRRNGKPSAFVVRGNRAAVRQTELGIHGTGAIEIKDGLAEGDMVITNPNHSVSYDGKRVTIQ